MRIYRELRGCRDFSFRDQIQRAAVSVPANIAEGVERNSAAEFRNLLGVAKGSAGEVRALVRIAGDLGYLEPDVEGRLLADGVRISKKIHSLILSLESRFSLKKKTVV